MIADTRPGNRSALEDSRSPAPGQMGIWERPLPTEPAGTVCRRARLAAHWSQARLASQLGISQPSLSRSESGRRTFGYGEVLAMAAALGVPADSLLGAGEARLSRHRRRKADQVDLPSVQLARRLGDSTVRQFIARGGSCRALSLAREGKQPLSAGQAAIALAVIDES